MPTSQRRRTPLAAFFTTALLTIGPNAAGLAFTPEADGVMLPLGPNLLKLQVCGERILRVLYAPERSFFARDSLMTHGMPCRAVPWELRADERRIEVATAAVTARVSLPNGRLTFVDRDGRILLAERQGGGRTLTPARVQDEETLHLRAEFEPTAGEAFYGLGQHQNGLFDYRGPDVDLYQHNIVAAVPFLVSSRGYGILWDNTSHTRFGDLRRPRSIPSQSLYDALGRAGGLTGTYRQGDCAAPVVATRIDPAIEFGAAENRPAVSSAHQAAQPTNEEVHPALGAGDVCIVWEGAIGSDATGEHQLALFSNNDVRLWFDGRPLVRTWRQGWLPWWDTHRLELAAGRRYPVRIEWRRNQGQGTLRLEWKTPPPYGYTSLWSEVGDGIDYYFVYGPELDRVVAGYRELTGRAPLMPRWAFGLWQSRERYRTAREGLDVLAELRRRRIPVDTLVQDWLYWPEGQWGSHAFDRQRFPDPEEWIRQIHDRYHARLMISVWPKLYAGTANFELLYEQGFLYPETLRRPTLDWRGWAHSFYDAFDPAARRLFWRLMERALFRKGVDAWWMDATEPELVGEGTAAALKASMHPTALGSGARMANAYALVSSQAVYEGQRESAPDRRVFILTRSAFAGSQRYAAATWSGDVSADWNSLRKQIPAGLNFVLSGIPYWTTDVGGFAVPPKWSRDDAGAEDLEEWRELFSRWFQYATFCPLLRVHGQHPPREPWQLGGEEHPAYRTVVAFDRLRYRLLPYIYSLAARVTRRHDTMMRALVMDFPDDPAVLGIGDQFLFGRSLLVNPVTAPGARTRPVYLPEAPGWYDFWTGGWIAGGQTLEAPAPYESLPLYVRAGAILPTGPDLQYSDEKPPEPLTLWVYTGADAAFDLYEDEGTDTGYETGAFAIIPLRWDEGRRALTIDRRSGSFPGMLDKRTFHVVFVTPRRAIGHGAKPVKPRIVAYDGRAVVVHAEPDQ
jgi:alpha-D-xyloside xylohydrolase